MWKNISLLLTNPLKIKISWKTFSKIEFMFLDLFCFPGSLSICSIFFQLSVQYKCILLECNWCFNDISITHIIWIQLNILIRVRILIIRAYTFNFSVIFNKSKIFYCIVVVFYLTMYKLFIYSFSSEMYLSVIFSVYLTAYVKVANVIVKS